MVAYNEVMSMYPARVKGRLTGDELITNCGEPTGLQVKDFWSWSNSGLLGNALRGKLAEYLVSVDLGCKSDVREEWDAYDLVTCDGVTVEVKSASYLQSWEQESLSNISFGIRPQGDGIVSF